MSYQKELDNLMLSKAKDRYYHNLYKNISRSEESVTPAVREVRVDPPGLVGAAKLNGRRHQLSWWRRSPPVQPTYPVRRAPKNQGTTRNGGGYEEQTSWMHGQQHGGRKRVVAARSARMDARMASRRQEEGGLQGALLVGTSGM